METAERETDHSIGLPPLRVAPAPAEHEETQLKDELLTVLLHDLRSPVGAVGVLTDLITTLLSRGDVPDARQLKLLQESVTKAQRVLDDAVEIQSIIRGSSTINSTTIDLASLVDSCMEKARHAPYFRKARIESNISPDRLFVNVDLEKMEAVILCVLEQIIGAYHSATILRFSASTGPGYVTLHMKTLKDQDRHGGQSTALTAKQRRTIRGRLGTRRLGESRYSFQICRKVLNLMGGKLTVTDPNWLSLDIRIPATTN